VHVLEQRILPVDGRGEDHGHVWTAIPTWPLSWADRTSISRVQRYAPLGMRQQAMPSIDRTRSGRNNLETRPKQQRRSGPRGGKKLWLQRDRRGRDPTPAPPACIRRRRMFLTDRIRCS
jgi:hypothetical protein